MGDGNYKDEDEISNWTLVLSEQSLLGPRPSELMTIFYCLVWDSPNLEGQVPAFISTRWPSYTPEHWVPFSSHIKTQGYGGWILIRLHTGYQLLVWLLPENEVEVTLRLLVSQSLPLVSIPLWDMLPDTNSVWKLLSCLCGLASLTRGRVCLLWVSISSPPGWGSTRIPPP
jgi:hypothetical protein